MQTTIVVGSGIAGVQTVQRLRQHGYEGRLVAVGAEPHPPYDRPPLSKQVLRGERGMPTLIPAGQEPDPMVEWRPGVTALHLDPTNRQLVTDAGTLDFDALVIATGARARRIPDLPGQVLRTWDDALRLRAVLTSERSLTVIGAGLIGCEVAASARALGVHVDLVDVLPAPMIRVVGPVLAQEVATLHAGRGVTLHLAVSVTAEPDGSLALSDGTILRPDIVLQAVGSIPDTDWLLGSGLDLTDGVQCDEFGHTALPGIYAVGDVAAWGGRRSEHWSNAGEQAEALAASLTGRDAPAAAVPYWWSDQYDIKFQGLGTVSEADEVRLLTWGPAARRLALYGRGGRVVGAVGLSAARAVLSLRADVGAGADLDEVAAKLAPESPAG